MADLVVLEGPEFLPPLEADVRVLDFYQREVSPPVLTHDSRFEDVDESLLSTTVPEPVCLRGVGGTTLFGLSNRFDDEFPQCLLGKVAREEFHITISRVNEILQKSIPWNLRCLLCGCLCCCCTLGLSLGPGIYLSKRLNLNWRLSQEQCEQNSLKAYVLLIEFQPKLPLYKPD